MSNNEVAHKFEASLITSHNPPRLSKAFRLEDGKLVKETGGNMVSGEVEKQTLTVLDFALLLPTLTPKQALCYGVNGHERASVVTADRLKTIKTTGKVPVIARTPEFLHWPEGAGMLLLDYDPAPNTTPLTREALLTALYEVWASLQTAPHVWRPSASSCIYRTDTGEELRGIRGQRVYVPVAKASDIERAGQVLFDRLCLAGYFRYEISKAGSLLKRSLIDGSVFQSNRLDFCGGAECSTGVEQRLPTPILINETAPYLDTFATLKDLSFEEEAQLKEIQSTVAAKLKPVVDSVKERWVAVRVEERLQEVPPEQQDKQRPMLTEAYRLACEDGRLLGDFVIDVKGIGIVKISEVLETPDRFHGKYCRDPLEPDYSDCAYSAWINLRSPGHSKIFSHAHGGRWYSIHRQVDEFQIKGGELHILADKCLAVMCQDGRIYQRMGELVRVTDSDEEIFVVKPEWLVLYLNRLVHFTKWSAKAEAWVPVDCPDRLAKSICAMAGEWALSELRAIISAPLMTPDGRILQEDGYDPETHLILRFENADTWTPIPLHPTDGQVKEALEALWFPFAKFPFVSAVDRGVHLAALLTAVQRPVLPTAPAFGDDAPAAGSGKSLLAKCVSTLAGVSAPEMLPPIKEGNEDEIRKRLFASAMHGDRVLVFDNVVGQMESPSLCAYLTAERFTDRVLGFSKLGSAPVTALMLITGNNIQPVGDLNRRVLRCRIDPEMEQPFTRRFDLNPFAYVQKHRMELVYDALVLLQAHRLSGHKTADSVASYEDWNDQVRAVVLWLGSKFPDFVADPLLSITETIAGDPETNKLSALLEAWHNAFGGTPTSVADAMKRACPKNDTRTYPEPDTTSDTALFDALNEIAGDLGRVNPRRLGRWIEKMAGKIANGKRFERAGSHGHGLKWSVGIPKARGVLVSFGEFLPSGLSFLAQKETVSQNTGTDIKKLTETHPNSPTPSQPQVSPDDDEGELI